MYEAFRLEEEARATIHKEAQLRGGRLIETGGALVGFVEDGVAVVTHATGPGPRSKRRRNSVFIDGAYTSECTFRLQEQSGGAIHYLGDWHVHTAQDTTLSKRDKEAAAALLESGACPVPYIMSVVFSKDLSLVSGYRIGAGAEIQLLRLSNSTG